MKSSSCVFLLQVLSERLFGLHWLRTMRPSLAICMKLLDARKASRLSVLWTVEHMEVCFITSFLCLCLTWENSRVLRNRFPYFSLSMIFHAPKESEMGCLGVQTMRTLATLLYSPPPAPPLTPGGIVYKISLCPQTGDIKHRFLSKLWGITCWLNAKSAVYSHCLLYLSLISKLCANF